MLLQVAGSPSFSRLNNILLYIIYTLYSMLYMCIYISINTSQFLYPFICCWTLPLCVLFDLLCFCLNGKNKQWSISKHISYKFDLQECHFVFLSTTVAQISNCAAEFMKLNQSNASFYLLWYWPPNKLNSKIPELIHAKKMLNNEFNRKNSGDLISWCVTHLQLRGKSEDPLPDKKKWDSPLSIT